MVHESVKLCKPRTIPGHDVFKLHTDQAVLWFGPFLVPLKAGTWVDNLCFKSEMNLELVSKHDVILTPFLH